MNGLQTINVLNQRAVEDAEAKRILKEHGFAVESTEKISTPDPQPVAVAKGE